MSNRALDDMDMVVGFRGAGGRIPVAEMAGAMSKSNIYNNIVISKSQVGMINTGDIAKIDASITLTMGSDSEEVGRALKILTQAVVDTGQIADDVRSELIDLLQSLSQQIVKDPRKSVVLALWDGIRARTEGIVDLSAKAVSLWALVKLTFGF